MIGSQIKIDAQTPRVLERPRLKLSKLGLDELKWMRGRGNVQKFTTKTRALLMLRSGIYETTPKGRVEIIRVIIDGYNTIESFPHYYWKPLTAAEARREL